MAGMADVIEACRANFGAPPRAWDAARIRAFDLRPWFVTRLLLAFHGDDTRFVLREQEGLRTHGRIVWAGVVQANEYLLDAASQNTDWDPAPVLLVYSPEHDYDDDPEELQTIAWRLNQLKGTAHGDPELNAVATLVSHGRLRPRRHPVPRSLTDGRPAFLTTTIVKPSSLPGRRMNRWALPIVIRPEATEWVTALPHDFWPDELRDEWLAPGE